MVSRLVAAPAVFLCALLAGAVHAASAVDFQLLRASIAGDLIAVDAALTAGANANALIQVEDTDDRFTPLVTAVLAGSEPVTRRLLQRGADPRAEETIAPLLAVALNERAIVAALMEAMGHRKDSDVPYADAVALSMDPRAACELRVMMLSSFLKATSDDEEENVSRLTLSSCLARPQDDPAQIAAILLRAGYLTPDDVPLTTAEQRRTDSLVRAVQAGHDEQVKQLLAEGADPSRPSSQDEWALPEAVLLGRIETVRALLAAGAPVEAHGPSQKRALLTAAEGNRPKIAFLLLEAGADPKRQGNGYDWPMRAAVRSAGWELIDIFRARGEGFFSPSGANVLDDYLLTDYSLEYGARRLRTLTASHYRVPSFLSSRGYPIAGPKGDQAVRSAINEATDLQWLEALRAAGAPLSAQAMKDAIVWKSRHVLDWLLANGGNAQDGEVLLAAARHSRGWPYLIQILLSAGAQGPSDPIRSQSLRKELVVLGSAEPLRVLLARRPLPRSCPSKTDASPSCEEAYELLYEAVSRGFPDVVRVLIDAGINPASSDSYGYSALHQVIDQDVRKRRKASEAGNPAPALPSGRVTEAASALLESSPAVLAAKTRWGKSPKDIAQLNPTTTKWLNDVVTGSAGGENDLHRAIRLNDEARAVLLVRAGAPLNATDNLQRTPLTLALQLQRPRIATLLLDQGASYTLEPVNDAQLADIDYSRDRHLAQAFLLRLLREQLLDVRGVSSEAAGHAALDRHEASSRNLRSNFDWSVTCEGCKGVIPLSGVDRFDILPLVSDRRPEFDRDADLASLPPARDVHWFRQDTFGPIPFELGSLYPWQGQLFPGREMVLTVSGVRRIPGCTFDPVGDRSCYPEVLVENTNQASSLEFRSSSGTVTIPLATLTVTQKGKVSTIKHGEARLFDRSLGPLDIQLGPVTGRVLGVQSVAVTAGVGPSIDYDLSKFALETRMPVYAAIAQQKLRRSKLPDTDDAAVKDKTLAVATQLLTAKLEAAKVPAHLEEILRTQADYLVSLDERLVELHQLLNVTLLTPQDLHQSIVRINLLLPQVSPKAREELVTLKQQVEAARDSVANSSIALDTLRGGFSTDVQRFAREYQSLILEYAQYVPNEKLAAIVEEEERRWIGKRLQPSDVLISDDAVGGRGAELRRLFGLPAPGP